LQVNIGMSGEPMLGEAITSYLGRVSAGDRDACARELNRFGRWYGFDKPLKSIQPVDLERYQEQLNATGVDNKRLEPLRGFLSDAKAKKLIETSLAVHVRLRRAKGAGKGSDARSNEPETVKMTEAGFANLKAELARLETEVRPEIQEMMQRAAADKDMRENAPYHAAKEKLSEVQTRINAIKAQLQASEIVEQTVSTISVGMGSTVAVRDLADNEEMSYTVVGPGEVNARQGKISIQSPMARALLDRTVGDTIEVETPSGRHRFRIERIEAN